MLFKTYTLSHEKMNNEAVVKKIMKKRVFVISDLSHWLGRSLPTCRRRLKKWHAHTSYNHNGRYYTLPEVISFNEYNIWHYQGISFSKHGNLKQTVVSLIMSSSSGLSATELGNILQMNPHSFLPQFQGEPELYREKIGGFFIWFAANKEVQEKQKQSRMSPQSPDLLTMPSDREAVMILVDLLHHLNTDISEIVSRLRHKRIILGIKVVHHFLAYHDLLKKTMDPN